MIDLINEKKTYAVSIQGVEYVLVSTTTYNSTDDSKQTYHNVYLKKDWDMGFLDEVEDWVKEEVVTYQSQCF